MNKTRAHTVTDIVIKLDWPVFAGCSVKDAFSILSCRTNTEGKQFVSSKTQVYKSRG